MKLQFIESKPQGPKTGTLVLLHGYGADEHDLLPLARELDPGLHAISLQAPLSLGGGARAWYSLGQRPDGSFLFDADEVRRGAELALGAIEHIARQEGGPVLVGGFSQGGGMSLMAALERPDLCKAVFSWSGVPPRADVPVAPREQLTKLRVFAAHGLYDPLLPIALGRQLRLLLEDKGVQLTWREYPMAHQICQPELEDARTFLRAL